MATVDPTTPAGTMPNGKTGGYTLIMSDEFNSTTLDSKWHNNHDFADNSATTAWDINAGGNSCLRMWWNGNTATDNQMMSSTGTNPFRTRFGFFEARIKMIQGKGFFGGWWLYPYSNSQQENSNGTQQEIDITEWFSTENTDHLVDTVNYQSKNAVFTVWKEGGGNSDGLNVQAGSLNLGGTGGYVPTLSTAFHTYGMEWSPTIGLQFYFDGVKRGAAIADPWGAANNLQLAVFLQLWWGPNGGNPTPTNGPTTIGSGQSMQWDYVRIWNIGGSPSPSPSPTPTPTPAPTPTPGPTAASAYGYTINQAVTDMSTASERLPIADYTNWQRAPVITQYSPAGSSIASWWVWERPTWCTGFLNWHTIYEAQGNTATNTRVEIRYLRNYFLSNATRTWVEFDVVAAPRTGVWNYPFTGGADDTNARAESDGGVSFKPVYPNFRHGYGKTNFPRVCLANPSDVRALFCAMDFRLVVDNAALTNDMANARYVVDCGGDYYPDCSTYAQWSQGYAPGAGNGRYLSAGPAYRTCSLLIPNTDMGCTNSELIGNPPPMGYGAVAPAPAPPPLTAALTSATFATGQTINGLAYFRVDGDSIANCELDGGTAGTYLPLYGRFTLAPGLGGSASRACTLNWDTTAISNGPITCHISAFDKPPMSGGTEIVVSTFNYIINNVAPSPISISATASAGPLNLDMQFVTSELDMLSRYIKTGKK